MDIAIIGGGVAGIEAANQLNKLGYEVTIFEKNEALGGHITSWDRLFPSFKPSGEVVDSLTAGLGKKPKVMLSANVTSVVASGDELMVEANGLSYSARAVLFATGFDLFPAARKEEYGYGIYDNVITSAELEAMFKQHGKPVMLNGNQPKRIAMIHCVGSRDEKVNRPYCSKVCCVTAVKQAIEIKEALPSAEIFCLYMDLRMFGVGYEDLYKQAQEVGVNFIRGRLSEASELEGGRVLIKTEDTLSSRPLKMSVDMVVLMVGMSPTESTADLIAGVGLKPSSDGFIAPADQHLKPVSTTASGVFVAGACAGPCSITDTLNAARSAALEIHAYLK